MRRMLVSFVVIVLALGVAAAQEPGAPKSPSRRALHDPNYVQVQFRDGSHLKMTLLANSVEMLTKYGKVAVPTPDVRRIEFGLRVPAAAAARVEAALGLIHDPKRGEAARAEIMQAGEFALPALRQAARRPDAVVERALLDDLKQRLPDEQFEARPHDTILAAEFPLTGKVEAAAWKARSRYFGDVLLRLDEVRTIRWLAAPEREDLQVDAAKYGTVAQLWFDSGVDLKGETVRIVASGMVDLYPMGGEKGVYMTAPNGNSRLGRQTPFPAGALIAKVGAEGKPFLVGERFEGSGARGRLFLRVEISPWQVQPLGSYTVRIANEP